MDRDRAIEIIEGLYPVDSMYPDTAEIGQGLLDQARREVLGWQKEPTPVLVRYAELCLQRENEADRRSLKKEF